MTAADLLKGQNAGFGDPLLNDRCGVGHVRPMPAIKIVRRLRFGQAIHAAEIAAIRNAYPQVAQYPAMGIDE